MEIREILEKLPPAPQGVWNWIYKDVIEKTYIIYNKKQDIAVCTRCGHKFRASRFNMIHNEEGECPKCKSRATYKASGIGRKNLTEYFRVLILTHKGNTVYGTLTEVIAEFKEMDKPQLSKMISAVYVFTGKEQNYWKYFPGGCWSYPRWEKIKNIRLPQPPGTMNYYAEPKFARTVIYEGNLESVFQKSCLKYGWQPDLFLRREFTPYDYISYINLHLKYKSIELLAKAGFENLVIDKVFGRPGSGCINWRGQSLQKILRLQRRHIKKLRGHEVDFPMLEVFQWLPEKEKMRPWNEIQKIAETLAYYRLKEIARYTNPIKWATWASRQNVYHSDWLDYVSDCEKLGLDTRKKSVLFPNDFQRIHLNLSKLVEEVENKEKEEKIKSVAEQYDLFFEDENMIVKIARSQAELNYESSRLCHCVKSYGDKVASGTTLIYFIRKKEDPETPFYTLEINPDGRFIQCRGKCNCIMSKEVKEFKDRVVAEFNKMLKKRERSVA